MKYLFSLPILAAEGRVIVSVEAPNETEARKNVEKSGNPTVYDEILVTKFGEPAFLGLARPDLKFKGNG